MGQTKCEKCGKLAHTGVNGVLYCADCVPKPASCTCGCEQPTEAVVEKKKSWWEKVKDLFIDGYAGGDLHI